MANRSKTNTTTSIAIIGMAGRFPKSKNLQEFWYNLMQGKSAISRFSDADLRAAGIDESLIKNPNYIKSASILDDIDKFDASFFDITPYEASIMDPQHRLFLEICWEALEVAGYIKAKDNFSIGVFAGMSDSAYLQNCLLKNYEFFNSNHSYQTHIATSSNFLATKVSYHLNLKGPSININTACSTSLVAVIEACQSLLAHKCDIAIAGGIAIHVPQIRGYLYQEGGILSKDGKCRAFDKRATGTVSADGAGVIILKRLDEALRDNDNIEAIIRSYGINNDGATKVGYTAPSILGQSHCISDALSSIDVESITYVEAHGTGTKLGDPIEISALTKAFRQYTNKKNYCALGSIKTNIGHADTAAGIAGVIKTILAIKNKTIPPTLNFKKPNPHINFSESPFYINNKATPWESNSLPRRAGVSSFGIGGTNAHIILEEASPQQSKKSSENAKIFLLSAKTETALTKQQEEFTNYLVNQKHSLSDNYLADVVYTLQTGRKEFFHRKAFVSCNQAELLKILTTDHDKIYDNFSSTKEEKPKIAFLFSGNGTSFPGMALPIYHEEPILRNYINDCCSNLEPPLDIVIKDYLLDVKKSNAIHNYPISCIQQLAIFILEYSIAQTLLQFGIKPDGMLGHSLGEYVAACISNVLTLRDAIHLVFARGKLIANLKPGGMLAIPLDINLLYTKGIIPRDDISISAVNSPRQCVLSGELDALHHIKFLLEEELEKNSLQAIFLDVPCAFHSFMVESILEKYAKTLNSVNFNIPQIPYISNVTGEWISDQQASDPSYFLTHFRKTVLFSAGISRLIAEGYNTFIEIGNGGHLTTFVKDHPSKNLYICFTTLPNKKEYLKNLNNYQNIIPHILAKCWVNHIPINWSNYQKNEKRGFLPLPTYPFEKRSHWIYPSNSTEETIERKQTNIYEPYWEICKNLKRVSLKQKRIWLIFMDDLNVGRKTFDYLATLDQDIICASQGTDFKKINKNFYELDFYNQDHYQQLFYNLKKEKKPPNYIINLLSLSNFHQSDRCASKEIYYTRSFMSLIFLSKAFLNDEREDDLNILIVTNYGQRVFINDLVMPEKSILKGPCLVIPQEYKNVSCRLVDISESEIIDANKLSEKLIGEFDEDNKKNIIAYRNGNRFIKQYKTYQSKHDASYLKNKGVYIIVGAFGRLGLELAEYLTKFQAHLILVSRTIPKENQYISERLKAIKKKATSLKIVKADAADYEQVLVLVRSIKETYHHLDGIFYLAASTKDISAKTLIKDIQLDHIKEQFSSKVHGANVLRAIIEETSPTFCCLYSSISSNIGGIGLTNYSAGNAYLDNLSEMYMNDQKTRWISINWDAIKFNKDHDFLSKEEKEPTEGKLTQNDISNFLFKILSPSMTSNLVVSATNLQSRIDKWINPKFEISRRNDNDSNKDSSDNYKQNHNKQNHQSIETDLKNIFQSCLGIKNIGRHDNFYDIGGNSLIAIRLLELIEKRFNAHLGLHDLIKYNIANLVDLIQKSKQMNSGSSIVKLSDASNKKSIFLIHPVGGTIFCYLELAKQLSPQISCYGIQDPSIDSGNFEFSNFSEMVEKYLADILNIQTNGKYFIGGFSLGGTIAFEIARQLEKRGKKIGAVFIIDSWAAFSPVFKNYDRFCQSIQHVIEDLEKNMPNISNKKKTLIDLAWQRMKLLFDYKLSSTDIPIILFKAKEILKEYISIDEETNHWRDYTKTIMAIHQIDGNHSTILKPKNSKTIAKLIKQFINQN